jgi:hypothetical protein
MMVSSKRDNPAMRQLNQIEGYGFTGGAGVSLKGSTGAQTGKKAPL